MFMLICICAAIWSQKRGDEATWWAFGAFLAFLPDVIIFATLTTGGCN